MNPLICDVAVARPLRKPLLGRRPAVTRGHEHRLASMCVSETRGALPGGARSWLESPVHLTSEAARELASTYGIRRIGQLLHHGLGCLTHGLYSNIMAALVTQLTTVSLWRADLNVLHSNPDFYYETCKWTGHEVLKARLYFVGLIDGEPQVDQRVPTACRKLQSLK
jgi:hypothetical protein